MNEKRDSARGCRSCLLVGCGLILFVVLVVAILTAANFGRIRDAVGGVVSQTKESFSELMDLRRELVAEFGTSSISLKTHFGSNGRTLSIEFVNAAFLEAEDFDAESKAREIASFAKDHYPAANELTGITVVFATRSGVGVNLSRRHPYPFSMEELGELGEPGDG